MKKLLATVLALTLTFGTFALPGAEGGLTLSDFSITASAEDSDEYGYIYGDFRYDYIYNGTTTIQINKYLGDTENVVIPEEINGQKVTSIAGNSFSGCTMKSLQIPDTVTEIGYDAFNGCINLTKVNIPSSLEILNKDTFSSCENIETIYFPDGFTAFNGNPFEGTKWLENQRHNSPYVVVNGILLDAKTVTGDSTVPNNVTEIMDNAFEGNTDITSIKIPSNVKSIGNYAFNDCTNLTSVIIDNEATNIGYGVFGGTMWLENEQRENTLVIINNILIDAHAAVGEVSIPDGVVSIGVGAFSGCINITNVIVPSSVKTIEASAFEGCTELTNITIPDSVTSIGDLAFNHCESLKSIHIPNGVENIGVFAFSSCNSLKEIVLPDSIKSIGTWAFLDCINLESVLIPDSVTSIEYMAFSGCSNLKNLTIGGGIKHIYASVFKDSVNIDNLVLREGIEEIDSYAFAEQPNLKYVVIPKSVTSIGERAFGFELYYLDENKYNYDYRYVDGFKLGVYAGTAGEEYAKTFNIPYEILPDHTHSYTSKVTKPATCIENGVKTYTCECGDSYTETIPATGHKYSDFVVTKPATCTEDGVKTKTCANCNDKITEKIPATGHKYGDFVVTKPATCTADGVKTKTCANCNDKITESIPKTGHTSSDWIIDKNAAINVKGSKHKECTVCKTVLETAEIPALPMISIQGASVSVSTNSYIFDNTAKTPSVTVTLNGKTLKNGVDYTVSYSNNKNVGLGIVTITGKGDYTGTIAKNFKIYPAKQSIQKLETRYKGFYVDWVQKGSATGYEVQYSTSSSMSGAVTKKLTANKPDTLTVNKLKSGKKYYVRVRSYTNVNGEVYYGDWSDVKSITTAKTDFKKAKISGIKTKSYTGKAIKQSIKVTYNGKTLKNGKDYTISYSNNKKVGTAKVTIKGKGTYGGVITKTFKINPAKQKIQKLTAKSKGFYIDFVQKQSATGYELQYSTSSKFSGAKKVTIKNNKTDKKTIKKLKANKKYYVRVRSYTVVNGTKYYGAWSAAKSVTTKK